MPTPDSSGLHPPDSSWPASTPSYSARRRFLDLWQESSGIDLWHRALYCEKSLGLRSGRARKRRDRVISLAHSAKPWLLQGCRRPCPVPQEPHLPHENSDRLPSLQVGTSSLRLDRLFDEASPQ